MPLPFLGEELLAVRKPVRLEEEAEDQRTLGGHGLVLVAGWAPAELAGAAHTLVVLERAFQHIGLLQRGVLVERHDGARRQLEQRGGSAVIVGIKLKF